MTETPILDSPVYPHGFVTGRYLTAVADGPDPDRLMDFTPAKGKVIFTPEMVIRRHEGPAPALVVQRPVTCELDGQGYLTSPGGGRGVALIAGIYTVRFDVQGAQVPGPTRIEVKDTHTEDAPLDLVLAMPDVVPPGSVVVVDESAEAVVTDLEAVVRAAVLASPELKGEPGEPGDPGEPGPPGEPGAPGAPGPAPSIKIGTVTSGTTPSATITGTSPDLTLGLVLPKGDKGDAGAPGAPGTVSSASSYVIVGPGRPDQPSTTAGTITGSEPVGARYESVDEAGVGARTWRKVPGNKWIVTDGDTGWRSIYTGSTEAGGAGVVDLRIRRRPGVTDFHALLSGTWNAGQWPIGAVGTLPRPGWQPDTPGHDNRFICGAPLFQNPGNHVPRFNGYGTVHWHGLFIQVKLNLENMPLGRVTSYGGQWTTAEPWPTAPLPGNPA